jgi:hypothetical protein
MQQQLALSGACSYPLRISISKLLMRRQRPCLFSCGYQRAALLRNDRNAWREALMIFWLLLGSEKRDLQALGAYFCRIFFLLGDEDLLPSIWLMDDA